MKHLECLTRFGFMFKMPHHVIYSRWHHIFHVTHCRLRHHLESRNVQHYLNPATFALPTLAYQLKEAVFEIPYILAQGNSYNLYVYRSDEPKTTDGKYLTPCQAHPTKDSPLQIEMECGGVVVDGGPPDPARYIKVWVQQPPLFSEVKTTYGESESGGQSFIKSEPDYRHGGLNFILEAEGERHGCFESKGPLESANGEHNWAATGDDIYQKYEIRDVTVYHDI